MRLRTNPAVEVLPRAGGVTLRLPLSNRALDATPFEAGLLRRFEEPISIDDMLAASVFKKEPARDFLERAAAAGFLLPDDGGDVVQPPLVDAVHRFCGAPSFRDDPQAALVVVGVPWDRDTTGRAGARFGPTSIRQASEGARYRLDPITLQPVGFVDTASGEELLRGIRMADAGDVLVVPGEDPKRSRGRTTDAVRAVLRAGAFPVVLGGDHSITRAALGALDEPVHVIHLDAHTDLGDATHGFGLHHGNVMTVVLDEVAHVEAIHQIGLRGVVDRLGHVAHPRVRQLGIDALRARGVDDFLAGVPADAPCWLSVDVDVVDPAFAPATGTPVPGGLTPWELKSLVRALGRARDFVGMDLVEVCEPTSPHDPTAPLAVACILSFAQGMVER